MSALALTLTPALPANSAIGLIGWRLRVWLEKTDRTLSYDRIDQYQFRTNLVCELRIRRGEDSWLTLVHDDEE